MQRGYKRVDKIECQLLLSQEIVIANPSIFMENPMSLAVVSSCFSSARRWHVQRGYKRVDKIG